MTSVLRREIFVRTRFIWFHCRLEAPEEVNFLRDMHRHEFHVELLVSVNHNERDIEFTLVKLWLDRYIAENFTGKKTAMSCETMAEMIWEEAVRVYWVEFATCQVSEDGENGANVYLEWNKVYAS